ncbi:hypothetical protein L4C36_19625 [Photobacterium japonica]|uniref:hypothetical protein n=1 Tax=Photobacterium japonica TaxID=2910235 RepID=UPI003D0A2750
MSTHSPASSPRSIGRFIAAMAATFSIPSHAHVRWFVPDGTNPDVTLPWDTLSLMITLITLGLFAFAATLSYAPVLPRAIKTGLDRPVVSTHPWLWYILVLVINTYLAINLLQGEFLAPNLYLSPQQAIYGVIIQASAIVLMAFSVSLTGVAIAGTALALVIFFPFFIALDYVFEFFFVGLALICIGPSLNHNDTRLCQGLGVDKTQWRTLAIHLLRIGLGLQLLELGLHNKLMLPGMALAFIEQHPYYNFFPLLNLPQVSHLHFVFFVGISEALIGLLLIFHFANRIIYALLLTIFMITLWLSGTDELIGHLPLITVVVILFIESGKENVR